MALTPKEREVLELLARNLSNKEIGLAMQVGEETVKWHVKNLFAKLDAGTRKQVVSRARILGLLPNPNRAAKAPDGLLDGGLAARTDVQGRADSPAAVRRFADALVGLPPLRWGACEGCRCLISGLAVADLRGTVFRHGDTA